MMSVTARIWAKLSQVQGESAEHTGVFEHFDAVIGSIWREAEWLQYFYQSPNRHVAGGFLHPGQ